MRSYRGVCEKEHPRSEGGSDRQAQRIQEERNEVDAEIAVKEKELEELKKIIGDENQTVKNVREAKEKMVEVQNRINVLRSRKSSHNRHDIRLNQ